MRIELILGISSLSKNVLSFDNSFFMNPTRTLEIIMDSPVIRHGKRWRESHSKNKDTDASLDLGLAPLAIAILSNSEEDVRSALAKHPHSIWERTYGMTVLHLSSRWPEGLSILLSAGAAELVDKTLNETGPFRALTAVDLALYFSCAEAVALLFDAGCAWHGFTQVTPIHDSACIQTVACRLAKRRNRLMCIAEATLKESQLSPLRQGCSVLDSNAAAVVRMVTAAGVDVPSALAVPESYVTIYQSGNLDISHFPVFFDFGFHDIHLKSNQGYMPIQIQDLGAFHARHDREVSSIGLLTPTLIEQLKALRFMDPSLPDTVPPQKNSTKTGWHPLAFRFTYEALCGCGTWEHVRAASLSVFSCLATDSCKCACSSAAGCLPLTIGLKTAAEHGFLNTAAKNSFTLDDWLLRVVRDDMAAELLRFLIFEALEMTHTCCKGIEKYLTECGSCSYKVYYILEEFKGTIDEIHEEEEELQQRLEELLLEFNAQFSETKKSLRDFVWGYWRKRMAAECVPVRDMDRVVENESGVNFESHCESALIEVRRPKN